MGRAVGWLFLAVFEREVCVLDAGHAPGMRMLIFPALGGYCFVGNVKGTVNTGVKFVLSAQYCEGRAVHPRQLCGVTRIRKERLPLGEADALTAGACAGRNKPTGWSGQ